MRAGEPSSQEKPKLKPNPDQAHARAEALFKKEVMAREGAKAMAEYEAERRAVREKTARLRALRLARDAAIVRPSAPKQRAT